ncbi:MAG: rhodanese-like domain-containing protein [Porphyromonadaceae bacterium]|nr:rhodanese-like domain-containing protein [Porphyromonadaceae bacterium]
MTIDIKRVAQWAIPTVIIAFFMFGFLKNMLGTASGNELSDALHQGAFLVDVRSQGEFAEGSVQGAVNIPLDEIENRIEEFEDKERIVVFCRSGNRSSQAKNILERHGITNVLNGGSWEHVSEINLKPHQHK